MRIQIGPLLIIFFACATPHPSVDDITKAAGPDPLRVRVEQGWVVGLHAGSTRAFKGIPYAAPPIGPLRWRPPEPPPSYVKDLEARDFGPLCMQTHPGDFSGTVIGSEDCLSLNIWTPANTATSALPVMVFIHGGFFTRGGGSLRHHGVYAYDGQHLAEQGRSVVVTFNYRLGPLGFLAHPGLSAESANGGSGNQGLLDQIALLKWVEANIRAFGGDPGRVMLFGQSAGAYSTAALIASPLARGLFAGALIESGSSISRSLADAEQNGLHLAAAVGCPSGAGAVACLRSRPASELIAAAPLSYQAGGFRWSANIDHAVIPVAPLEAMKRGAHNHVPIVVGSTRDELSTMIKEFFPTPPSNEAEYRADLRVLVGRNASRVAERYPSSEFGGPLPALVSAMSDQIFTCPARTMARALAGSQTEPVWRYLFSHRFHRGPLVALGAGHGLELPLVFGNAEPAIGYPLDEEERTLGDQMLSAWSAFATTGDPSSAKEAWPRYQPGSEPTLELETPTHVTLNARQELCDFWDQIGR